MQSVLLNPAIVFYLLSTCSCSISPCLLNLFITALTKEGLMGVQCAYEIFLCGRESAKITDFQPYTIGDLQFAQPFPPTVVSILFYNHQHSRGS